MLKIRNGVDFYKLAKFGFRPKYNEDTGIVERYIFEGFRCTKTDSEPISVLKIEIARKLPTKRTEPITWQVTYIESDAIDIIYDLIKEGIVEKVEEK